MLFRSEVDSPQVPKDPLILDLNRDGKVSTTPGKRYFDMDANFLMTSDRKKLRGETAEKLPEAMMDEWLIFAFTRPMMYEPGEKFSYGNLAPYVAGRMLEKTVGMSVCDYLYEKFWSRIGTAKPRWDTDSKGHTFPKRIFL